MKKIGSVSSIKELKLDTLSRGTIIKNGYSVEEIIVAARQGTLKKLHGIGPVQADRIWSAVARAGFIMEESRESQAVRKLLATAFGFPLGSTEEYESRKEFTLWQRDRLLMLMSRALLPNDVRAVKLRYGLMGTDPMSQVEIAEIFEVSKERVQQMEARALKRLRHPQTRKRLMEIFPGWPGFTAVNPRLGKNYTGPIEEMPIYELDTLSEAVYRCLEAAGIETVGQLMQYTYAEVAALCGNLRSKANCVVSALWVYNCDLKPENLT